MNPLTLQQQHPDVYSILKEAAESWDCECEAYATENSIVVRACDCAPGFPFDVFELRGSLLVHTEWEATSNGCFQSDYPKSVFSQGLDATSLWYLTKLAYADKISNLLPMTNTPALLRHPRLFEWLNEMSNLGYESWYKEDGKYSLFNPAFEGERIYFSLKAGGRVNWTEIANNNTTSRFIGTISEADLVNALKTWEEVLLHVPAYDKPRYIRWVADLKRKNVTVKQLFSGLSDDDNLSVNPWDNMLRTHAYAVNDPQPAFDLEQDEDPALSLNIPLLSAEHVQGRVFRLIARDEKARNLINKIEELIGAACESQVVGDKSYHTLTVDFDIWELNSPEEIASAINELLD